MSTLVPAALISRSAEIASNGPIMNETMPMPSEIARGKIETEKHHPARWRR